jgi:uncharacterized protein YegP (UPF0339 family)
MRGALSARRPVLGRRNPHAMPSAAHGRGQEAAGGIECVLEQSRAETCPLAAWRARVESRRSSPAARVDHQHPSEEHHMAGYFECKPAANGQFMFNLKAGNHEVILTSELYTTKTACTGGIESVRKNALIDANFTRKVAKDGSDYFVLVAANHQTVGKSEMYSSASAMEKGIASVKANAPAAAIKDLC